jgi:WD40 repeat protein
MSADFNSSEIRNALTKHYTTEDLRTLCSDLGIPYEELNVGRYETPSSIAREMIAWLNRRDRLSELEPHLYGVKVVYGKGASSPPAIQPPVTTSGGQGPAAADGQPPAGSLGNSPGADAGGSDSPFGTKVAEGGGRQATANSSPPRRGWVYWALTLLVGVGLALMLVWVFLYAPDALPAYKQRMVGIACALLMGLFAFLLTGGIRLGSKSLQTPFGEVSITATGGVAVFVLSLIYWLSSVSPITPVSGDNPGPDPTPSPTVKDGNKDPEWNVTPLAPLLAQSRVNEVSLSRDGELLASAEEGGAVHVWRVRSGSPPKELSKSGQLSPARCVAIGPNDQTIGAGSDDGKIRIWRTSDDGTPTLIASHGDKVYELYFSPDGQRAVSTGADSGNARVARLWKLSDKPELLKSFKLPNLGDQILAVSADLLTVITYNSSHKRVELWSLPDSKLQTALEDSSLEAKAGAFSRDGQTIAVGSDTGSVGLWRAKDGKLLRKLEGASERVVCVAVSPDGQMVAAGYPDGSVYLWNSNKAKALFTAREHTQRVFSLAFSANGRVLASGGEDGKIQLWEIKSKG